jgi:hypothetical protein
MRKRDHLVDLGGDGRVILKSMFKKKDGRQGTWTGLIWIRIGADVGAFVYL